MVRIPLAVRSASRWPRGSIALGLGALPLALHLGCSPIGSSPHGSGGAVGSGGIGPLGTGGAGTSGGSAGAGGSVGAVLPYAEQALPGYTLIGSPENDASAAFDAFLVDMDGNVVHTWPITGFPPKLLPAGSLIGCHGVFPGSYDCVAMEQRSWDGELEWSFSDFAMTAQLSAARHHHDFQREGSPTGYYAPGLLPLASGKTLVLALEDRTLPELHDGIIEEDVIYEVGAAGELLRVLWKASEHVDEIGFDAAALADIMTQPEEPLELLHGNSLMLVGDNPWRAQGHPEFAPQNLVYSSRRANFVAIISAQTGEIVWKIGPDFAGKPEAVLGQFVGQHFAHIVPAGLPGAGNMLVLDNGGGSGYGGPLSDPHGFRYTRNYSRVIEFNPITFEVVWEYGEPAGPTTFFTQFLGAAQRLPNGNTLLTIGGEGRVIEVTPDKEIVWQYQYESSGSGTQAWVYRAIRFPPEWLPNGESALRSRYPSWSGLYEGGPAAGGAGTGGSQ